MFSSLTVCSELGTAKGVVLPNHLTPKYFPSFIVFQFYLSEEYLWG